ncbi:hypothetical protein [Halonatronum saccharophilum]|uniref:hypothetical protein n=1 Tax=Halonatronum saccharophilum TaxID=150060 RepID=UPI000483E86E|nr:hypothetical protein [Halonatronum saccharophilum]
MKRVKIILIIIFILFIRQGSLESRGILGDSLDRFWSGISGDKAKYEGYLAEIIDKEVYINLGEYNNIYEGDIFDLYRERRILKDPVTGLILGDIKVKIGEVEVAEVDKFHSSGNINYNSGKRARVGDKVEMRTGSRSIALVASKGQGINQRLFEELIDNLEYKIENNEIYSLISDLKVQKVKDELEFGENLRRHQLELLREELEVDFFLKIELSEGVNNLFLHGQFLGGKSLDLIGEDILTISKDEKLVQLYNNDPEEKSYSLLYKSDKLDYNGESFVIADLNNDQNKEIVLNTRDSIKILSYSNDDIIELDSINEYSLTPYDDYKLLAINDIEGEGDVVIFEFLNNLYQLRWDGEEYSIEFLEGFFRNRAKAMIQINSKDLLITRNNQNLLRFNQWQGDNYLEEFNLRVKSNEGFRVKAGDLKGKGQDNIVITSYDGNEDYKIKVYDLEGKLINTFPGAYAPIINLSDIRSGGEKEIFLVEYEEDSSKLVSWKWDGEDFIKVWESKKFEGKIKDIVVADITGDFRQELIFLLAGEEGSNFYIYEFKNK